MLMLRQPEAAVSTVPMQPLDRLEYAPVKVGATVASLRPPIKGTLRCTLNGAPLYPITDRQWQRHLRIVEQRGEDAGRKYLRGAVKRARVWHTTTLAPGDCLVWHVVPNDRDSLRTIITVAVAVGFFVVSGGTSLSGLALLQAAATGLSLGLFVGNLLVMPSPADAAQQQGGQVYSAALQGNQARLDQPIWRNCGIVKIQPPFASQPYVEFIDDDGDGLDSDQYYYALFAVGYGRHDVLSTWIGKTPIASFQDVLTASYLPPGTAPTKVLANVVTSTEVAALELDTEKIVGGYVASQPRRLAQAIGIDIVCPQGLGAGGNLTVEWQVDWRPIDNYGRPTGDWQILGIEQRTANTNTPQRWSYRYELPAPERCEVRITRLDEKDTSAGARHSLQWAGLRAYLDEPAPLNPYVAHYEVVMRASEQLSGQSQRDFSLLVQGYARTWTEADGWSCDLHDWDNYTATRNPAWYLADLWTDPIWGEGRDPARIDMIGIADMADLWATRQDRFDFCFATATSAMDAAQLIAGVGRARCFERLGVATLARDGLVTVPRAALSPRNTVAGSMSITEQIPRPPALADGVVLEYMSNVTWDIDAIECPAPGYSATDPGSDYYDAALPEMARPVYLRIEGVCGRKHAERTGLFEAARRFYRRRTVSCTTPMMGATLAFGDAALWQPEIAGIGQSGDVAEWDAATLTLTLTEPLAFDAASGTTTIALQRDDGTLTEAVEVAAGDDPRVVILPAAPDFEIVWDDAMRERTRWFASHATPEVARIIEIRDGGRSDGGEGEQGAQLYEITAFLDDDRVHAADNALLPGPGEIQDPVEVAEGESVAPRVTAEVRSTVTFSSITATSSLVLQPDGVAMGVSSSSGSTPIENQWRADAPIDPSVAALYEVKAKAAKIGSLPYEAPTGPLGTWVALDTSPTWSITAGGELVSDGSSYFFGDVRRGARITFAVREIGQTTVQSTASVKLIIEDGVHA